MNKIHFIALAATFAAVSACNSQAPVTGNSAVNEAAAEQSSQVYSGTGTVQSITGDQVAIAHGPISGIGWPAMTMTFTARSGMANGVKAGDKVDFSFRKNGSAYVLTSVKPK